MHHLQAEGLDVAVLEITNYVWFNNYYKHENLHGAIR